MNSGEVLLGFDRRAGLLVDSNLLVLLVVGSVNRRRIENFKRTRSYREADFDMLLRVLDRFQHLYTLAHVAAEVSNLTDLPGPDRLHARRVLRRLLTVQEPAVASRRAADSALYDSLGLVDAAIAELARETQCGVITDDLDLYLLLSREHIPVVNFTHLREQAWGV